MTATLGSIEQASGISTMLNNYAHVLINYMYIYTLLLSIIFGLHLSFTLTLETFSLMIDKFSHNIGIVPDL